MRNFQTTLLSAPDTASATGGAVDVNQVVSASFVPNCGDITAAGTVKLQASNQNPGTQQNFVPTRWADIPSATSTIAAGVGPAIVVPNMAFRYIRAVFTWTSGGSSTITVEMNGLSL